MTTFSEFEQIANDLLTEYRVPGCMVAIAKNGEIVYEHGFGYRNIDRQDKVDQHTVFGLASLTKSFTCAAIMQLAEKGLLSIHDPVTDYLPSFHINSEIDSKNISIHHFMTHSSGLPPMSALDFAMVRKPNPPGMRDYAKLPSEESQLKSYEDLLSFIKGSNTGLIATPGKLFSYSNEAYSLLGAIIEVVSGIPYEEYVLRNIAKPCGMEHTNFIFDDNHVHANISICYEEEERDEGSIIYVAKDWWDAPPMRATGFLKSTAKDMIAYTQLYLQKGIVNGKRILSEDSVMSMLQPHMKMDPEKKYGYGFAVMPNYFGTTLIDHGGSLQSISSKLALLPEEGVSAIVLCNLSGFPASQLMNSMLNTYFGRNYHDTFPIYGTFDFGDNERIFSYQGIYTSEEGMDIVLKIRDNTIHFLYKDKEYPARFVNETVLIAMIDGAPEPIEFICNEQGEVYALSIFHRIVHKVHTSGEEGT